MKKLLVIPRIQIHNANALSSPYTLGFPAMTSWMGAMHALQRHLKSSSEKKLKAISFKAIAVVNHSFNLRTYQGKGDYIQSIIGKGVPIKRNGKKASFIEEPYCDLTVSIIIECDNKSIKDGSKLTSMVDTLIMSKMKFAGGDVITAKPSIFLEQDEYELHSLVSKIMPGHCLIERRDLMKSYMAQNNNDSLDALLQGLTTHYNCIEQTDDNGNITVEWDKKSKRNQEGWIIPIAVGYQGLTELNIAQDQRDESTLHRFAEAIVTLGEFKMPHQIESLDDMLWQYHYQSANNLYLCQQQES